MLIFVLGLALGAVVGLIDCWLNKRNDSPLYRVKIGKRRYVACVNCVAAWMLIFGVVFAIISICEDTVGFFNTPVEAVDLFDRSSIMLPPVCDRELSMLTGCRMFN